MKYRILPNLLETIIKKRYDLLGVEDLLVNQVLHVDESMETALNLDTEQERAGLVDSEIITGSFRIPTECLDEISSNFYANILSRTLG